VTLNGGFVHEEQIKSGALLARGTVADENMASAGLLLLALLGAALVSVAGNPQVRNMDSLGTVSVCKSRLVRNYCPDAGFLSYFK
jgi:hypothetical protein